MTVSFEKNPDGSISLPVSADIVKAMSLDERGSVTMDFQDGQLVIRDARNKSAHRQKKPKYTMEELLADYDQMPRDPEEDRLWLNSPPVGRELI